jgi:hypothetical protein
MLKKFSEQLSGSDTKKPPFALRASDLDANFKMCLPRVLDGNNQPYRVDWGGGEGWMLRGGVLFDVCENGKPVKYRVFAQKELA